MSTQKKSWHCWPLVAIILVCFLSPASRAATPEAADQGLKPILSYISSAWDTLTRSMTSCESVVDPKLAAPSILYLPADFDAPAGVQKLQQDCKIDVERLPVLIKKPGQVDPRTINPPGLLFLENSYVVPGGRFNEMYGWDRYFIIRGLQQDGRLDLALGMMENFFLEFYHYETVLNANRT